MTTESYTVTGIDIFEGIDWRTKVDTNRTVSTGIAPSEVNPETIRSIFKNSGMKGDPTKLDIAYYYKNKNCVWLTYNCGEYYQIGNVNTLDLSFGEYSSEHVSDNPASVNGGWYSSHGQYFYPEFVDDAIEAFVKRLNSEEPGHRLDHPKSEKLEIIKIRQDKKLVFESHYDYLDAMLVPFWKLVFDKDPNEIGQGGIVGAHGDKAYGYKSDWNAFKIPFHRGALLFLLTYTSLMNLPKSESGQWVITNYPFYEKLIEQAEKQVLLEKFGIVA